jgi:hypothetical protein
MRFALIFLIALFACEPGRQQPSRAEIMYWLSAYEESPAIGEVRGDVAGALMALASDESEKRFYRERALLLLRAYPDERVLLFLSAWSTEREPFLAVRAFASLAALSEDGRIGELSEKVRRMKYPTMEEEALQISSLLRFNLEQESRP